MEFVGVRTSMPAILYDNLYCFKNTLMRFSGNSVHIANTGQFTLAQTKKSQRGSKGIALLSL
jgi:hypothetical protein